MKVQDFVIADISNWLCEYSKYIVKFEFIDEKAIFICIFNNLPKSAYNEIRDISLEKGFTIDIGHDSIILY